MPVAQYDLKTGKKYSRMYNRKVFSLSYIANPHNTISGFFTDTSKAHSIEKDENDISNLVN